ncbi:MAG: thioredoxin family protein, partial [Candidatus Binatia bacterium]
MSMRLLIVSLLLATPVAGLEIGAAMPAADVAMRGVDGQSVSLSQIAGKQGTLVVFTCNHCPWAKAWETRLAALGNAYATRGVGAIAVNANDPSEHKEDGYDAMVARAKTLGLGFPYVVDAKSTVARAFGAERTPEAFLFDASGKLVYHGTVDDNAEQADAVKVH